MKIPLADIVAQYKSVKNEIDAAAIRVFESGRYIGGPELEAFEREFASYNSIGYGIGCSSGTTAIQAVLMGMDIASGDEVILPANTFIATAEAVSNTGATPVFVDIDPARNSIDPEKLKHSITAKTKAVIVVHLYGQPAEMNKILMIAREKNIKVIEDCAQAHGAKYSGLRKDGQNAGTMGDAGCFSFFPSKNLGAFGDAGMIITSCEKLAEKIRMLINHGRLDKYIHEMIGTNFRMDPLQAALLRVKLAKLDTWNARRLDIAKRYNEGLKDLPVTTPVIFSDSTPVFHLYVIRTDSRDAVAEHLKEAGVSTGIHYPVPLHLQPAYKTLGYYSGDFPEVELAAKEILSLPLYPEMTDEQVDYVIAKMKECF